jgi:hypothetical protein
MYVLSIQSLNEETHTAMSETTKPPNSKKKKMVRNNNSIRIYYVPTDATVA